MSDDFDDIQVEDDEENENVARIGKNDLKRLRAAAKEGRTARTELDGLKREKAVSDAGLKDLNAKQIAALARLVEDPTPESLRAEAEALGWVQPVEDPNAVTDQELDQHAEASAVANGAGTPTSRRATPDEINGWGQDKRMRLYDTHPDLHELVLRGQEIDLPVGFQ